MRGEAETYTSRALSRTQKFLRRKRVVSLETTPKVSVSLANNLKPDLKF